jgi:hypothetical protein
MFSETIEVSVTFGTTARFFLRMLSLAEEETFRQRIFGHKKEEAADKEYSANVALLAELSSEMPEGLFPNRPEDDKDGKALTYAEDLTSPREAIEKFFAQRSTIKERIAFFAVRGYFLKLSPMESFF